MTDILRTIILVIVHTPVWVWILYALLLFLGLQRTRDSVVPLWRMLILPVVVTLLAASSVIGGSLDAVSATLFGLAAGAVVGWPLERNGSVRRMPGGTLLLRGEWLSLVQIVLVLITRYATNAVGAMNPVLSANPFWHLGTLFVCSLLSGVFLGRTASRLRTYFDTPLQPLAETAETASV
jgi:hypothetical protein